MPWRSEALLSAFGEGISTQSGAMSQPQDRGERKEKKRKRKEKFTLFSDHNGSSRGGSPELQDRGVPLALSMWLNSRYMTQSQHSQRYSCVCCGQAM